MEVLWNPMRIEQRNGRLVRALQRKSVVEVHNFHGSGSEVEGMIGETGARKRGFIEGMMG